MNRRLIPIFGLLCSSAAAALGAEDELGYSPDGGLVSFGEFDYVYDSASRLTEVWSNGVRVVENQYDALGRRVIKRTLDATHTFVYDGWLLVVERIERSGGQLDHLDYWWGKDISGTLDGAGGIGGLLYLRKNGLEVYVSLYDGHGNVIQYVDKHGSLVAEYAYDAFGNTIRKSGVKADELKMRFSTKYSDDESGLYYFGRRFYSPRIARWLSRDPLEEQGGLNLYAFCGNNAVKWVDPLGMEILVIKRMIGVVPPDGWGDFGRNNAQTHYKEPKIIVNEIKKPRGKIGFEVTIEPKVSIVEIYFKKGVCPPVLLGQEMEHVRLYRRYDKAVEEFKRRVEAIVDCPTAARRRREKEELILRAEKARIVAEDNALDAPGGPHGH